MSAVRVWREGLRGMIEADALYPGHQGYVLEEEYQSAVAVMAQMAEALRKCRIFCFATRERALADTALSAQRTISEQSARDPRQ